MPSVKMFGSGLLAHIYLYRLNILFLSLGMLIFFTWNEYIKFNIHIAIQFLLENIWSYAHIPLFELSYKLIIGLLQAFYLKELWCMGPKLEC